MFVKGLPQVRLVLKLEGVDVNPGDKKELDELGQDLIVRHYGEVGGLFLDLNLGTLTSR
jgi:hypothetical protein